MPNDTEEKDRQAFEGESFYRPDGSHDDLGVSPEDRQKETADLESLYRSESEPETERNGTHAEDQELNKLGVRSSPSNSIPYRQEGKTKKKKTSGSKNRLKKKLAIGGGIAAIGVTLSIFGFLALLPLKMMHIVENLQNKFFATPNSAVEKLSDKIFSDYIKREVLPAMRKGNCSSTKVDKSCVVITPGAGKIDRLYQAWSQSNFEGKLAQNYGLEFSKRGSNLYMSLPGRDTIDVTDFTSSQQNLLDYIDTKEGSRLNRVQRSQLREQVRTALQNETKFKRVIYRYRVGKFLEKKYGVRRCVFACKTRDNFADWKDQKKNAFKVMVVQRAVEPHSQYLAVILDCLISGGEGSDCGKTTSVDADGVGDSKEEQEIMSKVDQYFAKFGIETTEQAIQAANAILDKGFTQWMIEQTFSKFGAENAEQLAGSTVAGVTWVDRILTVSRKIQSAGPGLKRLVYVTNAAAMVQLWMMYRSHVDEIKRGYVDPELVGSFNNALGDVTTNGENAEVSPLYQDLLSDKPQAMTQSTVASLLTPKVFAEATTHKNTYTCDNGKPIENGKLICDEESLVTNNFITKLSDFFRDGPLGEVLNAAWVIWTPVHQVLATAQGALNVLLAPFTAIIAKVAQPLIGQFQNVMEALIRFLVPSPISPDMSGARNFNMMAGGADSSGNDYTHYRVGGRLLSDQEVAAIRNEQAQIEQTRLAMKPWTQRYFDTQDSDSLIAQAAMSVPGSVDSGARSVASSMLTNPFSKLLGVMGSIMSPKRAAAAAAQPDPFGIPQYGYGLDDPIFNADLSQFTPEYCSQYENWANLTSSGGQAETDPLTGQAINRTTNPCLLLDTTVEGLGAIYDSSLIDGIDADTGSSAASTGTTSTSGIVGDIGQSSDGVPCASGTNDLGVVTSKYTGSFKITPGPLLIRLCQVPDIPGEGNNASGVESSGGAVVNSRVSGAWAALGKRAKADSISLYSNSSFRLADSCSGTGDGSLCARPGGSAHQLGVAIDFAGMSVTGGADCSTRAHAPLSAAWNWLYKNAESFGIKQYSEEAWHWDLLNLPNRCGSGT